MVSQKTTIQKDLECKKGGLKLRKFLALFSAISLIFTLCACKNTTITKNNDLIASGDNTNSYTSSSTPSDISSDLSSSNPSANDNNESGEPKVETFIPVGESFTLDGQKYTLSFFDDFEGDKLDSKKWQCCPEYTRQDYGGKWNDDLAWVKDGYLNIGVSRADDGTLLSGAIRTKTKWERDLFSQARGYFEIKCKLPKATGCWSAFWLMSDVSKVGNGAVDGAEIDIMESFDPRGGLINHAIHCDGYGADHKSIGCETKNKSLYDGKFHTFALLWNKNGYYFYVDGVQTNKLDNTQSGFLGSCEVAAYMKITAEFGSWGGEVNDNLLPDALVVDYVRVYKEVD